LYAEEARINPTGATTAAMMPNGAWLENEMSVNFAEEIASGKISFKTMKTPVISAITDKTSFKGDEKLRELIRWIDGGKVGEKPSFASDADVKIVEEARGIYRPQLGLVFLIPAYATAKDLAKDFLRFLYSDEGALIYASATQGINLPIVGLDYSSANISEFQKSKFEIINSPNARIMLEPGSSPMAISGGRLTAFETVEGARMEAVFSVSNPADFKPANEIFLAKYEYAVKNWNTYMKNAGLLD
jgi:ABC-type glycerol-3-phosphate transport system substrate-binding protein